MRIKDSIWQGDFGYWQSPFIHEHLLEIGHAAWQGFSTVGHGMVICEVDLPANLAVDWSVDCIRYDLQFISQIESNIHLRRLELESAEITLLNQTIEAYHPSAEILLLITGCGQIEVNFLQRLGISPPDAYAQVDRRRAEFQTTA